MAKQDSQALAIVSPPAEPGLNLPVTQADVDALSRQRALFHRFVQDQMKVEVDYGVIPGTQKPSLYKPGAEKLAQLFGLGTRVTLISEAFDRDKNFALFNYRAEIFVLRNPSMVIAQCEGSCNSQEKKYRERAVYEWNKASGRKEFVRTEPTPVCDILNTLQKMAQKRAVVGAVILATAASDFFTHDVDDGDDAEQLGLNPNPAPAPTVVKANIPKSTAARSHNQAGPTPAPATVAPQSKPADPDAFENFQGPGFGSPAPTVETLRVEVLRLMDQLKYSQATLDKHCMVIFAKAPLDLTIPELKRLKGQYEEHLSKAGVK